METIVYIVAIVISFGLTFASGKFLIPMLKKLHLGQTIREDGPTWHKGKEGTPTMGGLMFILGITVAVAVSAILLIVLGMEETVYSMTKQIGGLLMALCFGVIGFIDDYISVKHKRNKGLGVIQKLSLQFLVAGAYLLSCALAGTSTEIYIPMFGPVELGFVYYILACGVIVGIVNAVNFTDGVDGLNSMVCFFPLLAFAFMSEYVGASGVGVMGMASAAACLAFLLWNFHPAKVFMGDTGSLFLGGMICAMAFGVERPILIFPAAIVPIIEILSVVLQVVYFKSTHGKRLFKMSPIHHHFEMKGWKEEKICIVFSMVSLLGSAVAYLIFIL